MSLVPFGFRDKHERSNHAKKENESPLGYLFAEELGTATGARVDETTTL